MICEDKSADPSNGAESQNGMQSETKLEWDSRLRMHPGGKFRSKKQ